MCVPPGERNEECFCKYARKRKRDKEIEREREREREREKGKKGRERKREKREEGKKGRERAHSASQGIPNKEKLTSKRLLEKLLLVFNIT